ncbi:DNA-directed DNA polymerase alpha catalytic subunit POL1 ASCRUDRAFT_158487 [Ascoidea rubescens DSM 1968]|uniref:DNA polymerase n=1 Tax=Ascoidea rubescens DSM 1968 TaxID=1344418 RepID=A0A1D2VIH1_9ASCO|nr:hypothetical protein ASCRUDRAFT_158487 [Ascoidea rubescens DSM 1968]ODV61419.1 hypothetical protein ASCRUDRAFT_158487 [Ascoidea rubescens DSM 1968]
METKKHWLYIYNRSPLTAPSRNGPRPATGRLRPPEWLDASAQCSAIRCICSFAEVCVTLRWVFRVLFTRRFLEFSVVFLFCFSSSSRRYSSSTMARKDKFAAYRAARAAKSSAAAYEDPEFESIYEEVDEETFRERKRAQLLEDNFIVDDNGEGYADNGLDDWDDSTRPRYHSDLDDDNGSNTSEIEQLDENGPGKQIKKKKIKKTMRINHFFKPDSLKSTKLKKHKLYNIDINDILNDFTNELPNHATDFDNNFDNNMDLDLPFDDNNNQEIKPVFKSEIKSEPDIESDSDTKIKLPQLKRNFQLLSKLKLEKNSNNDNKTSTIKAEEEEDDDDDSSDDNTVVLRKPRRTTAKINRSINLNSVRTTISTPCHLNNYNVDLNPSSSPSKSVIYSSPSQSQSQSYKFEEDDIIDENNTFKMYWLDYAEANDGSLLLFGKIPSNKSTSQFVSAVVQINNICRELYFLPKQSKKTNDNDNDNNNDNDSDIHQEIVPLLLEKYGLETIRAKPELMKYCFEKAEIPKETEYLKVLLPFQAPQNRNVIIPSDLEGKTFSGVFGANKSLFETFILQKDVMGPCWLEISNPDFDSLSNISHCAIEVSISNPKYINTIDNTKQKSLNLSSPPLNCISISVQTIMNSKDNKQEVASVSFAVFKNLPQDQPIDEDLKPDEILTLIRPVGVLKSVLPPGLQNIANKQNFPLRTFNNEKTLLSCLCALIKKNDPDVFIGHRLENVSLDVLMHRLNDLKVQNWSFFGRRNRKVWPDSFNRRNRNLSSIFQLREVFQGRLLCDIANELGQSLTPKCQSWDLNEMYEIVCNKKHSVLDYNLNDSKYSEDPNYLLMALRENIENIRISAAIAFEIQILSLSKQLTNIAGNSWSLTLNGTRAGRNESILLHEFTRKGYIVPDKESLWQRKNNAGQNRVDDNNPVEDNESNQISTNNRKSKFQGGLVFDPEKGLHKNYILVMDFNSLYPSIIQEFNICFTTVDRDEYNTTFNDEKLPEYPSNNEEQGVLPKLLHTLVSRRREVKKLLKNPNNTPFEKMQYDVRQQALKLTANSMYGCLGYVNSRFYAKPLAMLVTNKGREILMDTRQLAESLHLRVIYGDTDSVMIDSGAQDYKEALVTAENFKQKVNERYNLLEIDTDNVFKRILLHSKKKYAALNVISFKNNVLKTNLEVKGLDMKRREYCPLSKEVSTFVLQKLLESEDDSDQILNEIYEYLEEITKKIKNNEFRVDKYKINTKLSKDPNNYPNGANMPPVQVALRLRKSGSIIKAGSVITYVITEGDALSPAERARPLKEMLAKNSKYIPDSKFYLEKQIMAPIERLLENIEGVDIFRLAETLDIDPRKYQMRSNNSASNPSELQPLDYNLTDKERFKDVEYLNLNCAYCQTKFLFGGIMASLHYQVTFSGIKCSNCEKVLPTLMITSQLERIIRSFISLHYAGWLVCDDPACGVITRQISVYGRRCIGLSGRSQDCRGIMSYRFNDKQLYTQLLYFDSIFNVEKNKKRELKPLDDADTSSDKGPELLSSGQVVALAEQNRELFEVIRTVTQKYLTNNARRYVDMSGIFGFMIPEEEEVN